MPEIPVPVDEERPGGPRSEKGARTRDRLLAAAKEIFEEHGFLESRISDIAERAELSYGSFYHYFTSKEEVFREVARTQEAELGTLLGPGAVGSGDFAAGDIEARIASALERYLGDYRAEADLMGVIEQVARFDVEVSAARAERHDEFREAMTRFIAQMQAEGMADRALLPSIAAAALTAMLTRFAEAWFVQGQVTPDFDQGVAQIVRIWVNALRLHEGEDDSPMKGEQ